MATENDEAIVLRLADYSETSQVASLFTAEHGLVRLIAKGARRSTKQRFATGLDLLEHGLVSFAPARGDAQLGTLTEWVQRDMFTGLRRALVRLQGGLYAVEVVTLLTEEADPHPELFAALRTTLVRLAGDGPPGPWLVWFLHALLKAVGYAPEFGACVSCRRPVTAQGPVFFSSAAGGLLCRDCEGHAAEKRRVPTGLIGRKPSVANAAAWVALLDGHVTHIAGRPARTGPQLVMLLRREADAPAPSA